MDCELQTIWLAGTGAALPPDTFDHLLHDQMVPRIRSHLGELVVHAAAIGTDDGVILLTGESGRGKSTLAACLQRLGGKLLGDDAAILEPAGGKVLTSATYSSLRLLPDSVEALIPRSRRTRRTAHYTSKLRIEPEEKEAPKQPLPGRALFILAPPDPSCSDIRLRPLEPARTCMELVQESFALDPTDTRLAAHRLHLAGQVASLLPAFELTYPREYGRLEEVARMLLDASGGTN